MCERGTMTLVPTPEWFWAERAIPEKGIAMDSCMADQLIAGWEVGVRTGGSCCGHGIEPPSIVLLNDDGQIELARTLFPNWTLYQWQLVTIQLGVINGR